MSEQPRQPDPTPASWLSTLGWAAYLACSWTWCIGMFLPVLLVRDYGIWGFVVFAVPNVVGAGAMGWVLKRQNQSREILQRHAIAVRAFTAVTIAFQLWFWIMFLFRASPLTASLSLSAEYIILPFFVACLFIGTIWRSKSRTLNALFVFLVSFALLAYAAKIGLPLPPSLGERSTFDLALLAPVCIFGFVLCPYLDVTFLHARESVDSRGSRLAFTLGFGVLFLLMILGTLAYAELLLPIGSVAARGTWPAMLVALHIVVQLAFTIIAHGRAIRAVGRTLEVWVSVIVLVGAAALIGAIFGQFGDGFVHHRLNGAEIAYRCFMSFYGLIFPAYVWLCMIPTRDGHSGIRGAQGQRKLIVLIVACLLAAPCFWMGFIERVEWWLAPGLGVVLLSRLLVRSVPNRRQLEN